MLFYFWHRGWKKSAADRNKVRCMSGCIRFLLIDVLLLIGSLCVHYFCGFFALVCHYLFYLLSSIFYCLCGRFVCCFISSVLLFVGLRVLNLRQIMQSCKWYIWVQRVTHLAGLLSPEVCRIKSDKGMAIFRSRDNPREAPLSLLTVNTFPPITQNVFNSLFWVMTTCSGLKIKTSSRTWYNTHRETTKLP